MRLNACQLNGKIIDVHTHSVGIALNQLLAGRYPYAQDIVDLSNTIRENGIDYAITFPMPNTIYYSRVNNTGKSFKEKYMISGNCKFPYEFENSYLVKIIHDMRLDNLLSFLSVSTNDEIDKQIDALYNLAENYPVYGLKYHSSIERKDINSAEFKQFALFAEKKNIPIMIHTELCDFSHPEQLIKFNINHPKVRICSAHAAAFYKPFYEHIQSEKGKNIFVDCSPFLRMLEDKQRIDEKHLLNFDFSNPQECFKRIFKEIPDNLLWGTDAPYYRFMKNDGTISTYKEESIIIKESEFKNHISNNTLRFLFGD